MFRPSLSIVVPAYNEAQNLPSVVPAMVDFVRAECGPAEIVLVDDGSRDGTAEAAAALAARYPEVRLLTIPSRGPPSRRLTGDGEERILAAGIGGAGGQQRDDRPLWRQHPGAGAGALSVGDQRLGGEGGATMEPKVLGGQAMSARELVTRAVHPTYSRT
jgi:glycosyltransferase involved in cell wall biosynthesis